MTSSLALPVDQPDSAMTNTQRELWGGGIIGSQKQVKVYSEGIDDMFDKLFVKYLCLINMIGLYFYNMYYFLNDCLMHCSLCSGCE